MILLEKLKWKFRDSDVEKHRLIKSLVVCNILLTTHFFEETGWVK